MQPLVSVIIPTFNRRDYVQEAIDSVLSQTYRGHEIIVIDDGSSDGTREALESRYGNTVLYRWQENSGESAARNLGLSLARGQFVAFLDSDDLWLVDKLAEQIRVLELNREVALVCAQTLAIDGNGQLLGHPAAPQNIRDGDLELEALCLNNVVPMSTTIVRRSNLDKVGGFDSAIRYGEDWDLWLRLRREGEFVLMAKPLAYIRNHLGAQRYLPHRDSIERILDDHLRLLTRLFETRSTEFTLELQNKALAQQYASAAFANFVWQNWQRGRALLERALALDPNTWRNESRLISMVRNGGVVLVELDADTEYSVIRDYVDATLAQLPKGPDALSNARRVVLGQLCSEIAFRAYQECDCQRSRAFYWHAFRANPALIGDRGSLRRFLSAVLGRT